MAETMLFWAIVAAMTFGVAMLILNGQRWSPRQPAKSPDVQVYRDQLAEIERDGMRGIIPADEAARMQLEVSRRLLAADKVGPQIAARGPGWPVTALLTGAALIGSAALYYRIGAPGYPDMSLSDRIAIADEARRSRPDQAAAETALGPRTEIAVDPDLNELMHKLRSAVATRPDDLQGQAFLAQYEGEIGNHAAAARAQAQVVRLRGKDASAIDHLQLADLLIRAAEGYVSPEAEDALTATLTAEPENGMARYYSGLLMAQTGRPDLGFALWQRLAETSAPNDPWMPPLRSGIAGLAELAGVDYAAVTAPASGAAGPDAAALAEAATMSDTDRQAMIGGMVEQLANRLATEGGTGDDWARLITSLGVLGENDRARAILAEAKTVFASSAPDLALLQIAAASAGIAD